MALQFPKNKFMCLVKVGEKGQFVIPKEAREVFGIRPGDTLVVLADENQGIAIPPKSMFSRVMSAVFGAEPAQEETEEDEAE